MVKNPEMQTKSQKISKNHFLDFFFEFFFLAEKKCYPLSFPILGGHNSTRALQSSPFLKYGNLKKSQKITFWSQWQRPLVNTYMYNWWTGPLKSYMKVGLWTNILICDIWSYLWKENPQSYSIHRLTHHISRSPIKHTVQLTFTQTRR